MYSRDERMKAIELYIKNDKSVASVIQKLGYPDRKLLPVWYKEYIKNQETNTMTEKRIRKTKFTSEQKKAAVQYFLEHGQNISRTVKKLGYPSRPTLVFWCDELAPETRKIRIRGIESTQEHKKEAVIALCTRPSSAQEIADEFDTTRAVLYNWKNIMLGKEKCAAMAKSKDKDLPNDRDVLLSEVEKLKHQIRKLKLEKDILEGTVEIVKKDPGVAPKNLTNKEKTILADALRNEYTLKELLECLGIARSSYFYHRKIASVPGKYEELRSLIIELFEKNCRRYGYRRIHALLVRAKTCISEKVVRRIMMESDLFVIGGKRRKYSSYQGENTPAADNLIERDFHAESPNVKWLTDITEFSIPAGKVYLSPIVDCFDGLLTSWSIGTSPDAELVNSMLDRATETLKDGEHPMVHSDRGCHYRWPGWLSRMEKAFLKRSMSKKGCTPDNAACEGFFGRLKNEMFYNRSWVDIEIDEFIDILSGYLVWYNEKRIKLSLGAMSPMEYRRSLGLAA